MTPKTFTALAVVTVLVGGGALYSAHERYGTAQSNRSEAILFPDLLASVNDVAKVAILDATSEINIERRDGIWIVASKHGYPADGAKVREAIFGLTQLRGIETKTAMAERYSRLEVEDVTEPDAKSHLWRLQDSNGGALAELILGKQRYDLGGTESRGIYVRKAGDAQSWLARGKLPVDQGAVQWLNRDAADIRIKRAHRVTTFDANGDKLVAIKDVPGDEHFRLDNVPQDFALKERWQWDVDGLGSSMSGISLDDVAPADTMDFTGSNVVRAELETFGGMIVRTSMIRNGEDGDAKWWLVFEAEVNPDPKASPSAEAKPTAIAEAGGQDSLDAQLEAEARIRTPEEIVAEVEAFNMRTNGWAYQIADFKAKSLLLRWSDLKAEPKTDKAS